MLRVYSQNNENHSLWFGVLISIFYFQPHSHCLDISSYIYTYIYVYIYVYIYMIVKNY